MEFSSPNNIIEVSPRIGGANNSRLLHMTMSGNSTATYTVYLDGGQELTTVHPTNNHTSIARFQYRPVTNNIAAWDCETVIDIRGNTTWSYAERNLFQNQLYTQTYTEGAQVVTISNRTVTLNLAQATTFFITTGPYFPNLNNHFINTLNIIKPNIPDTVTLGVNMILANVTNVTTLAWRNAGVRWPNGEVPPSSHDLNSAQYCGILDVYSLMNFNNVIDYFSSNNYTIELVNPGAELGSNTGWTGNRGFDSIANSTGSPAQVGNYSFGFTDPGAVFTGAYYGSAIQSIVLDTGNDGFISDIDSGKANVNISWYQRSVTSASPAGLGIRYIAANGATISSLYSSVTNLGSTFVYRGLKGIIPSGTRRFDIELVGRKLTNYANLRAYFDNVSTIKIDRFWNTPNAVRSTANTFQNNIWYGFAPYLKKRFSWDTAVDVCMLLDNQPSPPWYTVRAEWYEHRATNPNRKFHFICINRNPEVDDPYFPLPPNLNDDDIFAVPPSVHYVNTCEGDPDKTTDWFNMMNLTEEICYGGVVRMFGRIDVPAFWGYELLNSYSAGENIRRLVLECKKYNIRVSGGTTTTGTGETNIWPLLGTGIAGLGGSWLTDYV